MKYNELTIYTLKEIQKDIQRQIESHINIETLKSAMEVSEMKHKQQALGHAIAALELEDQARLK